MKDSIISYLETQDKAKTLIEINDFLKLKSSEELKELQNNIEELIKVGLIHETKKNKYILMSKCKSLVTGKIEINQKGYGFVIQDNDDDVFVNRDNLNGAIDDDLVLVDLFRRNGKTEGKVLKILERNTTKVVGEISFVNKEIVFIPDNKKLNLEIQISNNLPNLVDGHKVIVELKKQTGERSFIGEITKVIGHKNEPGIDILSIACKYGIDYEFANDLLDEVETIPYEVNNNELKDTN